MAPKKMPQAFHCIISNSMCLWRGVPSLCVLLEEHLHKEIAATY